MIRIDVKYFEPGMIQCCECGHKPYDPWDTDPEGFDQHELGDIYCDDCMFTVREQEQLERTIAAVEAREER